MRSSSSVDLSVLSSSTPVDPNELTVEQNKALFYVYQNAAQNTGLLEAGINRIKLKSGQAVHVHLSANILTAASYRHPEQLRFHVFSSDSNIGSGVSSDTHPIEKTLKLGKDKSGKDCFIAKKSSNVVKKSDEVFPKDVVLTDSVKKEFITNTVGKYNKIFFIGRQFNYLRPKYPVFFRFSNGLKFFMIEKNLKEQQRHNNNEWSGDLLDKLAEKVCGKNAKECSLEERFELGFLIARAIQELNESGILWLDVKPDNMIQAADGRVYLFDWGFSLLQSELAPNKPLPPCGTALYAAPEIYRREVGWSFEDGWRRDMCSYGRLLAAIFNGDLLYTGKDGITYRAKQPLNVGNGLYDLSNKVDIEAHKMLLDYIAKMCHDIPSERPTFHEASEYNADRLRDEKIVRLKKDYADEEAKSDFVLNLSSAHYYALIFYNELRQLHTWITNGEYAYQFASRVAAVDGLADKNCLDHFIFMLGQKTLVGCKSAQEIEDTIFNAIKGFYSVHNELQEFARQYETQCQNQYEQWLANRQRYINSYCNDYPLNSLDNLIKLTEKLNNKVLHNKSASLQPVGGSSRIFGSSNSKNHAIAPVNKNEIGPSAKGLAAKR